MFDPLRLTRQDDLLVHLDLSEEGYDVFRCVGYGSIYNHTYPPVARYRLQSLLDQNELELEVFKDTKQNFHIQAYICMEEKPFSVDFLSILGTDSIGFMQQRKDHEPVHTVYDRILQPDEALDHYKYICDPEELPDDPYALGYTQDGNGNWYMMITRSQGRIKQFYNGQKRRCWEYYDSDSHESLLIEMIEAPSPSDRKFLIYRGIRLMREQIHIDITDTPLSMHHHDQKQLADSHTV